MFYSTTPWGRDRTSGELFVLIGIVIGGRAGMLKEKELGEEEKKNQ